MITLKLKQPNTKPFPLCQDNEMAYPTPILCEECGDNLAINKEGTIWCSNGKCKLEIIFNVVDASISKVE